MIEPQRLLNITNVRFGVSELVVIESTWSPEFIQDLLPSAERTALLYNLSFLCLGSFPKLERKIRDQAIETQLLFGTSEAVLLKCAGTSSNLVTSLFPILIKAVEKNKPVLAVKYLEKARTWIKDIIEAVDDMVERYDKQAQNVKTCTSDVYEEQKETDEKRKEHTVEMKGLEKALVELKTDLKKNDSDMNEIEKRIEKSTQELHHLIINNRNYRYSFLWGLFRFDRYYNDDAIRAKQAELTRLVSEKNSLRNQGWNIKIKQTDLQLKLANCKLEQSVIPNPVHLKEVQKCLDQIRQILVDLKKFWEKVAVMVETLKDKTFVGEELIEDLEDMKEEFLNSIEEAKKEVQKCLDQIRQILVDLKKFWEKVAVMVETLKDKTFVGEELIEDLEDMKEEFLNSIEEAKKDWKKFGAGCQRAQNIFSVQSRTAYKFLEVNPSSFSKALVVSESIWSPEFIQELLLSAERMALLYHLSFVCLGKFPKLEYLIRKQVIETHLLFRSSEAVLLKDWQRFGECCQNAQDIFSVQSKSGYKLQEINPSSLSGDEWNKQYESIMEKLRKISPQGSMRE
ncbi:hypothetical protein DPX16_0592 [Anabarilius grahami]|uniref:Uncharacterized protein n=1 Tax=Anabarilius grahami TaxID=495550 RepID=A0A3N0XKU3_ANAGA|nr:hypothetical protein DPX16_0592 [Anabarilius grahami]